MSKFMSNHTLPPGAFTREAVERFAEAAQKDKVIRGYRSFFNLSEGKVTCILEAPTQSDVEAWFQTMGIPFDNVTPVELEGERGDIKAA